LTRLEEFDEALKICREILTAGPENDLIYNRVNKVIVYIEKKRKKD